MVNGRPQQRRPRDATRSAALSPPLPSVPVAPIGDISAVGNKILHEHPRAGSAVNTSERSRCSRRYLSRDRCAALTARCVQHVRVPYIFALYPMDESVGGGVCPALEDTRLPGAAMTSTVAASGGGLPQSAGDTGRERALIFIVRGTPAAVRGCREKARRPPCVTTAGAFASVRGAVQCAAVSLWRRSDHQAGARGGMGGRAPCGRSSRPP
jgi:hypothetical protein